jgi:hypothetical protein
VSSRRDSTRRADAQPLAGVVMPELRMTLFCRPDASRCRVAFLFSVGSLRYDLSRPSFEIGDDLVAGVLQFGEVLEAADHLSHDEQQELIDILRRRLTQASRDRLVAEVNESRQEFTDGRCLPTTPSELMREIMK